MTRRLAIVPRLVAMLLCATSARGAHADDVATDSTHVALPDSIVTPDSLQANPPGSSQARRDAAPGGDAAASPAGASVKPPATTAFSYRWDAFQQSVVRPATRALDPALLVRKLTRRRREAANVDAEHRVRLPSTWWQPRVGYRTVTAQDLATGPGPGDGPAPGPWRVTSAKAEGVSKGFQMQDASGVRYAIKFDPVAWPELGTGADAVVSRLVWAAGYNAPDNTIVFFRREDLIIKPGAKTTVAGHEVPMTEAYLDQLLRDVPREPDGSYRVVASRFLSGKPIGEFLFSGVRRDDPEDRIPHELRRELRGLWAVAAWVNHTDASARNTLDTWITDGGRSFVRHHLLDFSGCLGSASIEPQPLHAGHEYFVDYGGIARNFVTLSLPVPAWDDHAVSPLVGVGRFDAATFDPDGWRTYLPNPAFDERTAADVRWGVRIVAAFSNELIEAAVARGHYSDPRAAAYLVHTLIERRDRLAARWLTPQEIASARQGATP